MTRGIDVLQNGPKERKLSGLENKSWWKIILYCTSFFLIFFISAIVVSLLTGGIQDPSARFAIREIFLRLPITLVLFWLFAHYVVKKPLSFFMIRKPTNEILKWVGIGFVLPLSVILIYLIFGKIELLGHADPLSSSVIIYLIVATISMALRAEYLKKFSLGDTCSGFLKKNGTLQSQFSVLQYYLVQFIY